MTYSIYFCKNCRKRFYGYKTGRGKCPKCHKHNSKRLHLNEMQNYPILENRPKRPIRGIKQ